MSRFSKPLVQQLSDERIRELAREYYGPSKPREIDYLAYLMDAADLNDWQTKAFTDMYAILKSGRFDWLTEKQQAAVTRAIHEFRIYTEDVAEGFLTRGWADTVIPVNKSEKAPPPAAPRNPVGFDDYDNDIPF